MIEETPIKKGMIIQKEIARQREQRAKLTPKNAIADGLVQLGNSLAEGMIQSSKTVDSGVASLLKSMEGQIKEQTQINQRMLQSLDENKTVQLEILDFLKNKQ